MSMLRNKPYLAGGDASTSTSINASVPGRSVKFGICWINLGGISVDVSEIMLPLKNILPKKNEFIK